VMTTGAEARAAAATPATPLGAAAAQQVGTVNTLVATAIGDTACETNGTSTHALHGLARARMEWNKRLWFSPALRGHV